MRLAVLCGGMLLVYSMAVIAINTHPEGAASTLQAAKAPQPVGFDAKIQRILSTSSATYFLSKQVMQTKWLKALNQWDVVVEKMAQRNAGAVLVWPAWFGDEAVFYVGLNSKEQRHVALPLEQLDKDIKAEGCASGAGKSGAQLWHLWANTIRFQVMADCEKAIEIVLGRHLISLLQEVGWTNEHIVFVMPEQVPRLALDHSDADVLEDVATPAGKSVTNIPWGIVIVEKTTGTRLIEKTTTSYVPVSPLGEVELAVESEGWHAEGVAGIMFAGTDAFKNGCSAFLATVANERLLLKQKQLWYTEAWGTKFTKEQFLKMRAPHETDISEASLKTNSPSSTVLHIATHGLSTAVFDHTCQNIEVEDIVSVVKASPQIKAIALNACSTAMDESNSLAAGLYRKTGLDIIAALWQLDDVAAGAFAEIYYKELIDLKHSPAKALQQAKIHVMKSNGFQHPYKWAPWIIMGVN